MEAASLPVTDLPAIAVAAPRRPGGGPIRRLGGMSALGLRAGASLLRPPFAWRREFAIQTWSIVRRSLPAIAIAIMAWGFAGPGLQAGNFLTLFGSIDRAGGFMVVAILREFGTFVTATAVAGVSGTMLTAELGARRVRGELDALEVLGVDPVRAIVAPRILALVAAMLGLDLIALVFGVLGGYIATVGVLGGTSGAFFASFFANTTAIDLVASVVKVGLFGLIIGVVCSWHGLHADGGPEGVGRAVNRAVVGCLIGIFFVNLVFTQWVLAAFPQTAVFR
jgi:phospholipid/cholesterol/gamma-HCH transport system permease protein